jgi:Pvc16 N-terminal domain
MIDKVLKFLVDDICYTDSVINNTGSTFDYLKLENFVADPETKREYVMLSIVNLEEEKTLKNGPIYEQLNGGLNKKNPTIYINLYILFICNQSEYQTAINKISKLIEIIQSKNVFTAEIILDLYSLNFEQLNHLWGILGGKYQPSVMYKARLVPIQASNLGPVASIEEIATNK